jgi:hypothetical protein
MWSKGLSPSDGSVQSIQTIIRTGYPLLPCDYQEGAAGDIYICCTVLSEIHQKNKCSSMILSIFQYVSYLSPYSSVFLKVSLHSLVWFIHCTVFSHVPSITKCFLVFPVYVPVALSSELLLGLLLYPS